MKQRLLIFFVIIFLSFAVALMWWNQAVKPAGESTTPVPFTISSGENARTIADRLHTEQLIRSPIAFFLIARFGGKGEALQAGDFLLSQSMDLNEIMNSLMHGMSDIRITIPEGWRNEEIALKLAKELGIPESEFLKHAKEGYMFPDTYQLSKEATASVVAEIMQKNFDTKVTQEIRSKAQTKGLDLNKLVIIASLVEREARFDSDRPLVASVILNRLKEEMSIDIDATIQYALGYQQNSKTWWKKELTLEDLKLDSPYNTYKHPGLPPGPISNPGLEAITAVAEAPETEYLFYVSEPSGKTYFSKTLDEHHKNVNTYLNR